MTVTIAADNTRCPQHGLRRLTRWGGQTTDVLLSDACVRCLDEEQEKRDKAVGFPPYHYNGDLARDLPHALQGHDVEGGCDCESVDGVTMPVEHMAALVRLSRHARRDPPPESTPS